jgi:tetratricopeptide (TPR) repeat protein
VETTNPYGFDPGNRKDFHDQFGQVTGFAYVPAKNYRDRAFISPLELVSLILSNRIAALEKAGRFAEAVPLAVNRHALLGDRAGGSSEFFEDPYKDMMNRLFNYGASLVNGGKEEDALRWAVYAGARYPNEERWQEFIVAAVNNRLVKFLRQGETARGRKFLDANAALLSAANYHTLEALTVDAELTARASGLRGGAGTAEARAILDAIDDAKGKALLGGARVTELRTAVIGKAAEILAGRGSGGAADWPAAIAWLVSALDRYGPNRRLEQTLAECRANHGVEFHNRFAAAWNKKDFDGAKKILAEGLALYPDNRQLLADKRTVEGSKRFAF